MEQCSEIGKCQNPLAFSKGCIDNPATCSEKNIFFFIREEPYGFLSNFWRALQVVDGVAYDSNERYYQCQKPKDAAVSAWVFHAPSPFLTMVVGHNLRPKEIRENWTEDVRLATMLKGLRAKFSQNPSLKQQLLATGDKALHEKNPDDFFWGYGDGTGKDYLGKLLMQVRAELREGV
jgi:ribA/ribD-fused uncharacterized protein